VPNKVKGLRNLLLLLMIKLKLQVVIIVSSNDQTCFPYRNVSLEPEALLIQCGAKGALPGNAY